MREARKMDYWLWTLGLGVWELTVPYFTIWLIEFNKPPSLFFYLGGARSKGFATLKNVSKLTFFDKIGHAKSVGFRLYSAIWRSESRISLRYLEITSISLIYSFLFFFRGRKNYHFGFPGIWTDSPAWPVRSKETLSWGLSWLPGGALGYFWSRYVPPGTPNWHPVLRKISPKIDTPF